MRYVLGISKQPVEDGLTPLTDRVVVNASVDYSRGYLDVIAPAFDEFSLREKSVLGLHAIAEIAGAALPRAREICGELRGTLAVMPPTWRPRLGTIKKPGEAVRALEPLVVRRRAIALVDHIDHLLQKAELVGGAVVFASGAFFRPLCGVKPEPDSEYYS
jgi:hypothetical protein